MANSVPFCPPVCLFLLPPAVSSIGQKRPRHREEKKREVTINRAASYPYSGRVISFCRGIGIASGAARRPSFVTIIRQRDLNTIVTLEKEFQTVIHFYSSFRDDLLLKTRLLEGYQILINCLWLVFHLKNVSNDERRSIAIQAQTWFDELFRGRLGLENTISPIRTSLERLKNSLPTELVKVVTLAREFFLKDDRCSQRVAHFHIGILYRSIGENRMASWYFSEVVRISEKHLKDIKELEDPMGIFVAYGYLAGVHVVKEQYAEAIPLYLKQLSLIRKGLVEPKEQYKVWGNLGNVHFANKQYDQAIEFYSKQRSSIEQEVENSEEKSKVFNKLGDTYFANEQYSEAITCYDLCLKEPLSDQIERYKIWGQLGKSHLMEKNFLQVIQCYQNQLEVAQTQEEQYEIWGNLGKAHLDGEQYEEATQWYLQQLSHAESLQDLTAIDKISDALGELSVRCHDYGNAFQYYSKQLQAAKKLNDSMSESTIWGKYADLYRLVGQDEDAQKCSLQQSNAIERFWRGQKQNQVFG